MRARARSRAVPERAGLAARARVRDLARADECAQEVFLSEALGDALSDREGPDLVNVPTKTLTQFSKEPARLSRADRRQLALHVAACASCQNELIVPRRLDAVLGAAQTREPSREPTPLSERVRKLFAQPALADRPGFVEVEVPAR
jgi:hypothetical protein